MPNPNHNKWTAAQIATVGSQVATLPDAEVLHWKGARDVTAAVQAILTETDTALAAIEDDAGLNQAGIDARRAEIAKAALEKIKTGSKLDVAKAHAARRAEALKAKVEKTRADNKPDAAEAVVHGEIRAHIAKSESPLTTATALARSNKQVAAAIFGAPAFLSGLTGEQIETLRSVITVDDSPEAKELQQIEKALAICDSTIRSAESLIATRAKMRKTTEGGWL